ncbi:MAG: Holliday junction branch migration protein RuvA [Halobacteriota archaeon]|nr:Holliday junction branch migration protein RuvA [Halobacteriota archaeon]
MISLIRGNLELKTEEFIIVDVSGIGFQLNIPLSTYACLPDLGEEVKLYTHLQMREDSIKLYGFSSMKERELFELLINISGVGPKIALAVLSDISATELQKAIGQEDLVKLTGISGIGKKTAQRLILELKEKIGVLGIEAEEVAGAMGNELLNDAVSALISLGYGQNEAKKSVSKASESLKGDYTLEDLVKKTLTFL